MLRYFNLYYFNEPSGPYTGKIQVAGKKEKKYNNLKTINTLRIQ